MIWFNMPEAGFKIEYTIKAIKTIERNFGKIITVLYTLTSTWLRILYKSNATSTAKTKPTNIKSRLYKTVLRSTRQASCEVKKNSKLSQPTQGLFQIPKFGLNCLKATLKPYIGK